MDPTGNTGFNTNMKRRWNLASKLFFCLFDRAENWPQAAPSREALGICSAYGHTWTCQIWRRRSCRSPVYCWKKFLLN